MLKKKCNKCSKKINKNFDFCPWCGHSFKKRKEKEDFGMIGREDYGDAGLMTSELKLPFGLNKIMGSLMKQIEKEMQNIEQGEMPKGFKIKLSTGMPQDMAKRQQMGENPSEKTPKEHISDAEKNRRSNLPRIEAESKMKRIGDTLIYEIDAPGIKSKKDIGVVELEQGIEIKIYTKDKCYTKTIPLKIEISKFQISKDKLIVEMKA